MGLGVCQISLVSIWFLYLLDMDECKMNTSICPGNSTCINRAEPIKFDCNCNFGFGKVDKICHSELLYLGFYFSFIQVISPKYRVPGFL